MTRDTKKCIRDFIKHVDALEAEEDPDGCGFQREYREIHEVQAKNRKENVFKSDDGKQESNLKKNRYKDILPYDDHRVLLSVIDHDPTSDYINASYLKGVKGSGGYIATQGPVAVTVGDFWRMVWENDVEIIFMACRIVELGKIKCKQYWNDAGLSDEFGDITVFTESEENVSSDFIQRHFKVTRGDETRSIKQYHYMGWPDHGIPKDPAHIRDLIGLMRKARAKDDAPLCVHCSAGCGRTGAIVAIDYVWTLLEEGKFDDSFSLYELICDFREQRMSIVQTPDQYALVNKVLKSLCEEWLARMASHTYENVELNGEDTAPEEEEHVYEDNVTLVSSMNTKESDSTLTVVVNQSEQENSGETNKNKAPEESVQQVQESPSPKKSPSSDTGNYVNIVLSQDTKKPEVVETPQAKDDRPPVHRTVIQIGTVASPLKKQQSADVETNEVVNLVTTPSFTRKPLKDKTMSLPASSTLPDEVVYSTVNKNRAKSDQHKTSKEPVLSIVPSPTNQAKREVQRPDEVVYSTVNKNRPPATITAPASQRRASTDGAARAKANGIDSKAVPTDQIPQTPPGFDERMPRVRGPMPMPTSWDNS